ncbi:MAG: hypothetical protein JSV22_11190 [Bacteroidales bacterium]|nr:MAG: hypothetical protein JSV22_11190 [Bacteroidales bacterium]
MDDSGVFTDPRNGITYKTVKISNRIWFAQNFNYNNQYSSWCYDDNPENAKIFGRLYNWESANSIAPKGWHLPSKNEWEALLDFFGGVGKQAFNNMSDKDFSGFNVLFSGIRTLNGDYYGLGSSSGFWSSTEDLNETAWGCFLDKDEKKAAMSSLHKNYGRSVRLVKDSPDPL